MKCAMDGSNGSMFGILQAEVSTRYGVLACHDLAITELIERWRNVVLMKSMVDINTIVERAITANFR